MSKGNTFVMGSGSGAGSGVVVAKSGTGECRTVLTFNDCVGRGGIRLLAPGIGEQAFRLLEEVGAMCPTFRLYGISSGEVRHPTKPELRRINFGPDRRAMDERTVRVAGLHSGVAYGSAPLVLVGGQTIMVPMCYDDQDEVQWRCDLDWYITRLLELAMLAPNLEIPVPGKGPLGSSEVGCSLAMLSFTIPTEFWATPPLSSDTRDAWMKPHLERRAKAALLDSAAANANAAG